MAARVLDGKEVARRMRERAKARVEALAARGIAPGLAVILVGDDPASRSYVAGKERDCAEVGIASLGRRLGAETRQEELLELIASCNADPAVHGILVQLPLPPQLDERLAIGSILPEKDVDGLTPANAGRLVLGEPCFRPCTPAGVIELLREAGVRTDGSRVAILGRSSLVGRPLANLLSMRPHNATVTLCHTGTRDPASICREADILVACAGSPGLVDSGWVKPGACVIDVGMTRVEDARAKAGYRLAGDVDYESVARVAGWITPVPGGVGPMTRAMLLDNALTAAERAAEARGRAGGRA